MLGALRVVMLCGPELDDIAFTDTGISIMLPRTAEAAEIGDAISDILSTTIPAHRLAARTHPTYAPPGPLVLLVEDNDINRTVAEALLSKRGLQTEIAHEGLQAVEMASTREYAAILMDCQMPGLDGYQATERIHAAETGRHTPIIAMTAHAMPGDRERCLAAGMDDYLAKPVRAAALDSVIERWLPGHDAHIPSTSAADITATDCRALPHGEQRLDQAAISQLRDTLTAEMRRALIQTFEVSLAKGIADMAAAAAHEDADELRRLTHLLKGSSASVGATGLSLAFQQLEQGITEADTIVEQQRLSELKTAVTTTCIALRNHLL